MQATTIDEVISALDQIIATAHEEKRRVGYFPALYRQVTIEVKKGIEEGFFEDGERMERLDVIFANRYLKALSQYQQGELPTRSWLVAFEATDRWWPIVLIHLLLGINAHINLDLGIAAARTSPGAQLAGLQGDFDKINGVLASLVDEVKRELTVIWPLRGLLDRLAGNSEDKIINFSMKIARQKAWEVAQRLAPLSEQEQVSEIADIDQQIALLGQVIWKPDPVTRLILATIRIGERGSVPQKIDILTGVTCKR